MTTTTTAAIITLTSTLTTEHVPTTRLAVSLPVWRRLCQEASAAATGLSGGAPDELHILPSDEDFEALDALDDELRERAQTVGEFVGGECCVLLPGAGIDGCDAWGRARVEEICEDVYG